MFLEIEKPASFTFWNYLKHKNITLHINNCPYCHSKCNIYVDTSNFQGWVQCPECGIRGYDYSTDTDQYEDFGIERSVKKWNNHEEHYFFMEAPDDYYLYSKTSDKLVSSKG